ncbi:hypothetical protein HK097_008730 [Rhizophlyctis rosea]|uniref:Nuclear pore protein n=1 Tax=Rhizophlyctis rosea TaxID=64517 RepID=A0AAD5SI27_9FUNG|nr:hypothetical protein HK097_008730 [Rhizophlyctis rosea]
MAHTNFGKLLEQSKQLNNHVALPGIPTLERTIDQIDSRSKNLLKRAQRDGGAGGTGATPVAVDTRTAFLLANRGFDTDKVSNVLNQINLARAFEPLEGINDTDIEKYLSNEHENIVSLAVDEGKRQTTQSYEDAFESAMHRDWATAKRRIFEELGQHQARSVPSGAPTIPTRDTGSFASMLNANGAANDGDARGRTSIDPKLRHYATIVKQLNESRRQKRDFDVIRNFLYATASTDTSAQRQLSSCWELLFQMLGGKTGELDQPGRLPLRERQFFDLHRDTETEDAKRFRQSMVEGARSWLEEAHSSWIVNTVHKQHGQIGGMPTVHQYVEEFLRLRFFRNGRWVPEWLELTDEQAPFWAHVYMLVRSGAKSEALNYIQQHSAFLAQNQNVRGFENYFRQWLNSPDGRLPKAHRDKLLADWNASVRNIAQQGGDMFKYALFKLIGRCEMNVKTIQNVEVVRTTEDYLWVQLMLAQENVYEGDTVHDRFTLRDMANGMMRHAGNYRNPVAWFNILLACGEFEQAVADLFQSDAYAVDAAHFAIALAYLGILRVPDASETHSGEISISVGRSTLSSGEPYDYRAFNLAHPLQDLVSSLKSTDSVTALHYTYIFGLLSSQTSATAPDDDVREQYPQLAHHLIRDVISAAENTDALIGSVGADGTNTTGEVEKFRKLVHLPTREAFVEHIIVQAAKEADTRGALSLAVNLYHVAREFGRVIEILNKQLADRLRQPEFVTAGRLGGSENVVELAAQVLEHYLANPLMSSRIDEVERNTCGTLISLAHFRENLVHESQYLQALAIFYGTGLFPESTDQAEIAAKVEAFKQVNSQILHTVPPILVEAMEVLQKESNKLRKQTSGYDTVGREQRLAQFKDRANALLQFAGALMHRIPGDALVKMNRSNTQMG